MKTRSEFQQHRYAAWAGDPKGRAYDPQRCAQSIWTDMWDHGRQCSRKPGHGPEGLFCRQHVPKTEETDMHSKLRTDHPSGPLTKPASGAPLNEFELFYQLGGAGETPANAVRLAIADFMARSGDRSSPFLSQLRRAERILDAFEARRFTLDRVLQAVAGDATEQDTAYDARQAFINAVA